MSSERNDGRKTPGRFEERKELEITTITPVFVGTGRQITPLSFVIDGNELLVVPDNFLSRLTPEQQASYVTWIESILERRQSLSLKSFLNSMGLQSSFIRRMRPRIVEFNRRPRRSGFGEHIKHPDGLPYIPGTEIKGALRTSIIFTLLDDATIYGDTLGRNLPRAKISELNEVAKRTEGTLLRAEGHENDAKYDLLRFVSISDTGVFSHGDLFIKQLEVFGRGDCHYIPLLNFETLVAGRQNRFEIRFGAPESVISGTHLDHMKEWLTLPKLLKACHKHSEAILDEELAYFDEHYPSLLPVIRCLKQQNCPSSPLLRLGAGQGFLGVTLALQVKNQNPPLYEALRKAVSWKRNWCTYPGNFPKTRRVVLDRKKEPSTLLGWVRISKPEDETQPVECSL